MTRSYTNRSDQKHWNCKTVGQRRPKPIFETYMTRPDVDTKISIANRRRVRSAEILGVITMTHLQMHPFHGDVWVDNKVGNQPSSFNFRFCHFKNYEYTPHTRKENRYFHKGNNVNPKIIMFWSCCFQHTLIIFLVEYQGMPFNWS